MKIIFAPDSFKGSLDAVRVCEVLGQVAKAHYPHAELISLPLADGGEGTVRALVRATGGRERVAQVTGPLGATVTARWGELPGGAAVLEMAETSGLTLVPPGGLDPLHATSRGLGELMAQGLRAGVRRFLIGIGGSASNDGGMGLLQALGARFCDARGNSLPGCGASLEAIASADLSGLLPELKDAHITVLCDVTNPLLGPEGATAVYGPQKGVTPALASRLEAGMAHYADVLEAALGRSFRDLPGAGAAGGVGAALGGVLSATLARGIDAVLDAVSFDRHLMDASLVVTGEGRLDSQSVLYGKVPAGVAARCAARGVPVVAIVGGLGPGAEAFYDLALSSIMVTVDRPMTLEAAMRDAEGGLRGAAERMFRLLTIGQVMEGH